MSFADWVRGGAYTKEPSEQNRRLYERERTPMLRWRLIALFSLVFWVILCAPIQLLVIGLTEWPEEWWMSVKQHIEIIRTGRLHG